MCYIHCIYKLNCITFIYSVPISLVERYLRDITGCASYIWVTSLFSTIIIAIKI